MKTIQNVISGQTCSWKWRRKRALSWICKAWWQRTLTEPYLSVGRPSSIVQRGNKRRKCIRFWQVSYFPFVSIIDWWGWAPVVAGPVVTRHTWSLLYSIGDLFSHEHRQLHLSRWYERHGAEGNAQAVQHGWMPGKLFRHFWVGSLRGGPCPYSRTFPWVLTSQPCPINSYAIHL